MLDFNDIAPPRPAPTSSQADLDSLRAQLITRLPTVLAGLYPAGKTVRGKFLIGDAMGSPGRSLEIVLEGDKAGLWTDRAAGLGGDAFDLLALLWGIDVKHDFVRLLERVSELLGHMSPPVRQDRNIATTKIKANPVIDELGPATAKWDYLDASGQLIAVVYRYDPPGGKKEFRPWDVKRRKAAPPEPRPLYNQPGLMAADRVILVEGEKCAKALIDLGICATTAMHGANAPVEKTDWLPLKGRSVLCWPDKDKAGWEYAQAACLAALMAGARDCAILIPPEDKPEGWDAADAVDEGWAITDFFARGPRAQVYLPDSLVASVNLHRGDADGEETALCHTEDGLALAFTKRYQNEWRYVAAWGKWLMWDGQRWRAENTLAASDLVRHVCRHASLETDNPRTAAKLAGSGTVGGVERLARTDRRHAGTTDEWDADLWIVNTPAGVVDLRTGRMRPHDRADRMTKVCTATVVPGSRCPTWLNFLDQVTGGDSKQIHYLQKVFGYCLTGSTQEHALFFLYGTGANGKSVFVNTLFTLMGDYATHAPMDTFMESRTERHPTDLAGLRGARFVAATETEQGRRWNESKIKEITGGDHVSARFMRQDFFTYLPQFKLVIAGNHKPAIRNIDEAMRRRLHLIPFTITVPPDKRDQHLQAKLLTERDAIFEWGVQGCLAWQQEGLQPPQCVLDATDEYFEAEDALGRWLNERCVRVPNAKSLTSELFNDWKQWGEAAGEFIGSQRRFSDVLLTRGVQKWRNSAGVRGFQGIGLKEKPQTNYAPYAEN